MQKAIRISYGGSEKLIAADIDCTVDLDPAQKGVHMSRFPELFEEAIEEVVIGEALLVESLAEHIAAHIVGARARCAPRSGSSRGIRSSGDAGHGAADAGDGLADRHRGGLRPAYAARRRRRGGRDQRLPVRAGARRGRAAERLGEAGFDERDVERILELVPLATHNQRGRGTLYVGTERRSTPSSWCGSSRAR